jgi:hypothetical protein
MLNFASIDEAWKTPSKPKKKKEGDVFKTAPQGAHTQHLLSKVPQFVKPEPQVQTHKVVNQPQVKTHKVVNKPQDQTHKELNQPQDLVISIRDNAIIKKLHKYTNEYKEIIVNEALFKFLNYKQENDYTNLIGLIVAMLLICDIYIRIYRS